MKWQRGTSDADIEDRRGDTGGGGYGGFRGGGLKIGLGGLIIIGLLSLIFRQNFFDELRSRFGASGDFAQAYVIAHEFGHHIQNILGIDEQVRRAQQRRPDLANELSVRLELQADCLAGVWGNSTGERKVLESGDVESGLNAAAAIGDDRIQRMSGRRVHPESFTHGSSTQRVEWFKRGLQSGQISACNTLGN